jgi:sigma-B regulation protein RsbU (phosphoserine phosphatase)
MVAPKLKIRLSLRAKILALLTLALAVSLMSYLYAGTSLIVEDKTSYIYDYNLAQARAVSDAVNSQIRKLTTSAGVIAGLLSENATRPDQIGARTADPDPTTLRKIFDRHAKELGLESILLLKPSSEAEFTRLAAFGIDPATESAKGDELLAQAGRLGWNPKTFAERPLMISATDDGRTILGGRSQDARGEPLVFVTAFRIDPAILQSVGKGFEVRLIDGRGKLLVSKSGNALSLAGPALAELEGGLAKGAFGAFGSGVRDWQVEGRKYMVSYDRIAQDQLLALSYVDREVAFSAAKTLVQRSLVLSVSILLLAIGVTFLFVRGLTARLRELWQATERVGRGDFSLRLDPSKGQSDEISDLAGSFNAMSSKIDELVLQTADKARMEKELETAQAVQSRFFPPENFTHTNLTLAGQYVPASECAGDWWHYR